MSNLRPTAGARPLLTAVSLVGFGLLATALFVSSVPAPPEPEAPVLEEIADRFVAIPELSVNPDSGEGARAKMEEGKVGRRADGGPAPQKKLDASSIGKVIGAKGQQVGSGGLGSRGSGLGGGGTAEGPGGLGTRGSGGSGVVGGLIGTKGLGSGASGYGRGGASFGAKGVAAQGAHKRRRTAAAPRPSPSTSVATLPPPTPTVDVPQPAQTRSSVATTSAVDEPGDASRPPLTSTAQDAKSTFAADVDTGSYTYARRMLRQGQLPTAESVRVEEFINFFRYDYAQPTGGKVLGVTSELVPHPTASGRHLLTIGVQAKTVAKDARRPVRLTFLVDTSGSMRGADRLGLAQRAMRHALLGLGDEDTVAIVTYAGSTRVALAPTPATRRSEIRAAIDDLRSGGGTAMDSGMALAYQQAEASYAEGAENRVIVLSDGDANIGRTGAEDMLKTIRRHAEGGITLTTMGFGTGNYQDARMERLADAGDGAYVYIDGWTEAQRVFGEQLGATLETVGRDVKLQVAFDPARVKGWRQVGYVNRQIADQDFRNDAVDAGEVGSGHQVTALYELDLRSGSGSVGDVHLRVKPPGPDRPATEWSAKLTRRASSRPSADTRTSLAAMHLADGLHDRDPAALRRALDAAEALQSAGCKGGSELAELSRLALSLMDEAEDRMAAR